MTVHTLTEEFRLKLMFLYVFKLLV